MSAGHQINARISAARISDRNDVLDGLSEIDAANVVRCARVLLRRPLLRVGGPDGDLLPLAYRHRHALTELFARVLGYRLVVRRQFARLYKALPGTTVVRGEPSLTPRGYAYLALTIAALTGVGRQVLLSRLVADVRAAAAEAGIEANDDMPDRRALTAALRHLVALGVIIMLLGVAIAPLPGPMGMPLVVIGLMLVLRNSFKARRQIVRFQQAHPKMVFPIRRLMRREPEIVLVFWQQYLRVERLVLPRRVRFAVKTRRHLKRRWLARAG